MTDTGAINLCNAIYQRAAEDYETALIRGDATEARIIKEFLLSGAYRKNNAAGVVIVQQMPLEIAAARNYVESFLSGAEVTQRIDASVIVRTVAKVVNAEYKRKCKVKQKNGKPYIVKCKSEVKRHERIKH